MESALVASSTDSREKRAGFPILQYLGSISNSVVELSEVG